MSPASYSCQGVLGGTVLDSHGNTATIKRTSARPFPLLVIPPKSVLGGTVHDSHWNTAIIKFTTAHPIPQLVIPTKACCGEPFLIIMGTLLL